jgi:hypothetical protein
LAARLGNLDIDAHDAELFEVTLAAMGVEFSREDVTTPTFR